MAPIQQAHVGETVRFDFVLVDGFGRRVHPTGLADYCVAQIGAERVESEPEPGGRFRFDHTFSHARSGDQVDVRAAAYRQRGARDFMYIQGQWLQSQSPYEWPDQRMAGDELTLTFYRAVVELAVVRPADDLDPDSGVLRLRRDDGSTTSVYIDRPNRPGFTLSGPDADGYYRVRYQPTADELDPVGTTDVELTIFDVAGKRHFVADAIDTP